eukprot:883705-Karenia_brevis.AAC.1
MEPDMMYMVHPNIADLIHPNINMLHDGRAPGLGPAPGPAPGPRPGPGNALAPCADLDLTRNLDL